MCIIFHHYKQLTKLLSEQLGQKEEDKDKGSKASGTSAAAADAKTHLETYQLETEAGIPSLDSYTCNRLNQLQRVVSS